MPILRSRKTQLLLSSLYLYFSAFLLSGKHLPEERKTPIGPIHAVFLLCPTQTSFSFPPAGTPEATSWEQGQMARPQTGLLQDLGLGDLGFQFPDGLDEARPFVWATCEKMLKFRDGPGGRDPRDPRKSGFSGRKPPGTRATT